MEWLAMFVPLAGIVLTHLLARRKIQEIHVLVNNRLDEALQRVIHLEAVLKERDA